MSVILITISPFIQIRIDGLSGNQQLEEESWFPKNLKAEEYLPHNQRQNSEFESKEEIVSENEKKERMLSEIEATLGRLFKEKEILMGDFYGINITAYRYVNIFDRLGYIRFKIREIEKEIKILEHRILELKEKLGKNKIP